MSKFYPIRLQVTDMISLHSQTCNLFGRVMGDPLHHTQCLWNATGYQCSNEVSKESRSHGAICLTMARVSSESQFRRNVTQAARYLLCENCRGYRDRVTECANRWANQLLQSERQLDALVRQGKNYDAWDRFLWPTVLSH